MSEFEEEDEEEIVKIENHKSLVNKDPVNYIKIMKKPKKYRKAVRFCVISDTHAKHDRLKLEEYGGDILIHCGDFTNWNDWRKFGTNWKVPSSSLLFNNYLGKLKHFKNKLIAIGNHDEGFVREYCKQYKYPEEKRMKLARETITNGKILDNELIEIEGINIFVLSYNFKRFDRNKKLEEWENIIPKNINILVCHFPPKFGGFDGLYDVIKKLKSLKVVCYGHFHKMYSVQRSNNVVFLSAASFSKKNMNPVIAFDYYV